MAIKVYKASAGSGKTYTLVYEYIRYLYEAWLANSQSTEYSLNLHRNILAVTFTNKATAEMKERIIKSL
jgi:ATP-dependent exoDNAse (exonuclease V) beta subunit